MTAMTCAGRTFNGGCHCGRYGYTIEVPETAGEKEMPELVFNTDRIHGGYTFHGLP